MTESQPIPSRPFPSQSEKYIPLSLFAVSADGWWLKASSGDLTPSSLRMLPIIGRFRPLVGASKTIPLPGLGRWSSPQGGTMLLNRLMRLFPPNFCSRQLP